MREQKRFIEKELGKILKKSNITMISNPKKNTMGMKRPTSIISLLEQSHIGAMIVIDSIGYIYWDDKKCKWIVKDYNGVAKCSTPYQKKAIDVLLNLP